MDERIFHLFKREKQKVSVESTLREENRHRCTQGIVVSGHQEDLLSRYLVIEQHVHQHRDE